MTRGVTVAMVGLLLMLAQPSIAQEPAITGGVNWLLENQDASGFWGAGGSTPYRDATVVLEVLGELKTANAEVDQGIQAVLRTSSTSTDYLARRILASSAGGWIPPGLADSLADRQNPDGGWAYQEGYGSNTLETALALAALKTAACDNGATMSLGVNLLLSTQNVDGGWGYTDDDSSRVFYTANVSLALALLRDDFSLETSLQNAADWMITQAHGDGGFGTGVASNVIETGIGLASISVVNPASPAAINARNYIEAAQLPNGSWNDDAYATAEALRGLVRQSAMAARSVDVVSGLNLLGLPVMPPSPLLASDLAASIPGTTEIRGWNSGTQSWRTDDFPVAVGDGFFAEVSTAGGTVFLGSRLDGSSCAPIEVGLNLVSLADNRACLTAYDLLSLMADDQEIHRWDETHQKWATVIQPLAGTLLGNDFLMRPGVGYFIRTSTAGEWCPPPCDTVEVELLPDLYLTSDDILLDPNPAPQNTPVFIGARFHNIGTDTAFLPRLDLYLGDPAAGGQLLAWGTIPDTIPPGEATPYFYGSEFTFESVGLYEIYAIADYLNEIPELDDNNNQASRILEITGVHALTPHPPSGGSPMSLGVGASRISGGVTAVAATYTLSVRGGLTSPGRAPSVVSITNVRTASRSSASAVVSWTTDVVTDGCVRYGIASVTENCLCFQGPLDDVHFIELGNLQAGTTYQFEVVSGGVIDDNDGAYHTFTTTAVGAGVPSVLYGKVLKADTTAATGALVYGTLTRAGVTSHSQVVCAGPDGTWTLNLGNLKDETTNDVLEYAAGDTIHFAIQAGLDGMGGDTVVLSGSSPQDAGVIALVACACPFQCDYDEDGYVTVLDLGWMIDVAFSGAPNLQDPACPTERLDFDCSGDVDILDIGDLIDYLFSGGPPPCKPCSQ